MNKIFVVLLLIGTTHAFADTVICSVSAVKNGKVTLAKQELSQQLNAIDATNRADLGSLNCEVDLVKRDGTFSKLSSGAVGVNLVTKIGKFDTFIPGSNGLDSNDYRVEVTFTPSATAYAINIQLLDRVGSASSSFFTISDGTHIVANLEATGKYEVLGDLSNFRIYLECK